MEVKTTINLMLNKDLNDSQRQKLNKLLIKLFRTHYDIKSDIYISPVY